MSMDGHFCMCCGEFHCACPNPRYADSDPARDIPGPKVLVVREPLRARLARHGQAIRRIEVIWYATGSGPRMTVTLKDRTGHQLDQWEDWMFSGSANDPGVAIIDDVISEVLGPNAIEACVAGSYHCSYTIR